MPIPPGAVDKRDFWANQQHEEDPDRIIGCSRWRVSLIVWQPGRAGGCSTSDVVRRLLDSSLIQTWSTTG